MKILLSVPEFLRADKADWTKLVGIFLELFFENAQTNVLVTEAESITNVWRSNILSQIKKLSSHPTKWLTDLLIGWVNKSRMKLGQNKWVVYLTAQIITRAVVLVKRNNVVIGAGVSCERGTGTGKQQQISKFKLCHSWSVAPCHLKRKKVARTKSTTHK